MTKYYKCEDCRGLWDYKNSQCPFCKSENITEPTSEQINAKLKEVVELLIANNDFDTLRVLNLNVGQIIKDAITGDTHEVVTIFWEKKEVTTLCNGYYETFNVSHFFIN